MSEFSLQTLFSILLLLIIISGYFSSSETAMMALNRYRLRHMVKQNHKGAMRASKLLEKPDRLIGIILIGNNFVNIFASAIATVIALQLFGEAGILIATVLLTMVILIFSEVTPKTIAAVHPEKLAFPFSIPLLFLLRIFYPLVWTVNAVSNSLVRLLGFDMDDEDSHHLSTEELKTIVYESATHIPTRHQNMLVNILDLEKVSVSDIMVPRSEVTGINIEDDINSIMQTITSSHHTRLPVYKGNLDNVVGILHMRKAAQLIKMDEVTRDHVLQLTLDSYFVPETTSLQTQLINFQKRKRRIAVVVDEYGDVQGIVTLEDILEEIVGNFTTNLAEDTDDIHPQKDGSFVIDGSANIREINRALDWDLPTDGSKTLNGLLTDILESIPENSVAIQLPYYRAEVLQVKDNMIKNVRIWPHLPDTENQESLF
ncbi:MAG: magnesium/cobalt efflux protein [Gammaproteobacteria bacterium]|nr:magnesium/cobalt efflux protein [Gammaproteobacteria bacterium]MAY03958.1 magnesium/cobalt efflux protein [Gammaproteobacteria bacterium]|tara:strand:+ start:1389 stop:2675 length:1287 start_codon:yes stop_codon:yes gene_type:complete